MKKLLLLTLCVCCLLSYQKLGFATQCPILKVESLPNHFDDLLVDYKNYTNDCIKFVRTSNLSASEWEKLDELMEKLYFTTIELENAEKQLSTSQQKRYTKITKKLWEKFLKLEYVSNTPNDETLSKKMDIYVIDLENAMKEMISLGNELNKLISLIGTAENGDTEAQNESIEISNKLEPCMKKCESNLSIIEDNKYNLKTSQWIRIMRSITQFDYTIIGPILLQLN